MYDRKSLFLPHYRASFKSVDSQPEAETFSGDVAQRFRCGIARAHWTSSTKATRRGAPVCHEIWELVPVLPIRLEPLSIQIPSFFEIIHQIGQQCLTKKTQANGIANSASRLQWFPLSQNIQRRAHTKIITAEETSKVARMTEFSIQVGPAFSEQL